jgi:hypothetical protein
MVALPIPWCVLIVAGITALVSVIVGVILASLFVIALACALALAALVLGRRLLTHSQVA